MRYFLFLFLSSSLRSHTYKVRLQRGRSAAPNTSVANTVRIYHPIMSSRHDRFKFFAFFQHTYSLYYLILRRRRRGAKLQQNASASDFSADAYIKNSHAGKIVRTIYYNNITHRQLFKCAYIIYAYRVSCTLRTFTSPKLIRFLRLFT